MSDYRSGKPPEAVRVRREDGLRPRLSCPDHPIAEPDDFSQSRDTIEMSPPVESAEDDFIDAPSKLEAVGTVKVGVKQRAEPDGPAIEDAGRAWPKWEGEGDEPMWWKRHPQYGECDNFDDPGCAQCRDMIQEAHSGLVAYELEIARLRSTPGERIEGWMTGDELLDLRHEVTGSAIIHNAHGHPMDDLEEGERAFTLTLHSSPLILKRETRANES